jgi:hypothetical protein
MPLAKINKPASKAKHPLFVIRGTGVADFSISIFSHVTHQAGPLTIACRMLLKTLKFLHLFNKLWLKNLAFEGIYSLGDQGQPEMLRAFEIPLVSFRADCGEKLNVRQRVRARFQREKNMISPDLALSSDGYLWAWRGRVLIVVGNISSPPNVITGLYQGKLPTI